MSSYQSNPEKLFYPFKSNLDFLSGALEKGAKCWNRKLSEMIEIYSEHNQSLSLLESEDTIVYKVYEYEMPKEQGHLIPVTTILYPGRVGDQFFMTKGHYHEEKGTAEVYLIISGEGVLLMQTEKGDYKEIYYSKGNLLYIPPFWAHRMVNVSNTEPLKFYGVYPANAGHDYDTIMNKGFRNKVVIDKKSPKNYKIIKS
jgi:glucose-6-phosphate isomerase